MKTPITEIERRELEQKFEAAGKPLYHPLPEYFLSDKCGTLGVGTRRPTKLGALQQFMEMDVICVAKPAGIHILWKFRYN